MNIFEIIPNRLYLSSEIDDWNLVNNVTAVINLQDSVIDQPTINWLNKVIIWLPIWDTPDYNVSVDANWLKCAIDIIEPLWKNNHNILIHCAMGENRSGMILAGLLMKINNWTSEQALEFIRIKQPKAVWNVVWQRRLKEYENILKG